MVYTAKDRAIFKMVKFGDKVKFDADQVNGQFTVMKIEKTKRRIASSHRSSLDVQPGECKRRIKCRLDDRSRCWPLPRLY